MFCHLRPSSRLKKPEVCRSRQPLMRKIAPHAYGEASVMIVISGGDGGGDHLAPFQRKMLSCSQWRLAIASSLKWTLAV